jgi:transposase
MPQKPRYTQAQILKARAEAGSNQGAAAALDVSIRTVDNAVMRAKREGKDVSAGKGAALSPLDPQATIKRLQKELKTAQAVSAEASRTERGARHRPRQARLNAHTGVDG